MVILFLRKIAFTMNILEHLKPVKQGNNFNLLPDGVFTIEQDGRIVDVNDKLLKMYNKTSYCFVTFQ